jgi:GT2 family glycosyltransferase
MASVAVVILNFNGEKLLQEFLPSVVQYSEEAKVYVADNSSTDNSITVLERLFPSVEIIPMPFNYGFCKGYNQALRCITAEIFVLVNSDIQVTKNWLVPILRLFETSSSVAAVQPKILSYRDKNKFEYAGAGGGMLDTLGYPFCRGRIFEHVEEDHGQYDDEREVFWASGACLAIRSSVFNSLGGFDEDFFAHMEEIDLCWRIQRSNLKVYYCGLSTVYHLGAATLSYNNPRKTFLNFRNNMWMLFKNFGPADIILKMPLRFLLDWVAALAFLIKGQPQNTIAVISAQVAVVTSANSTLRKRRMLRKMSGYSAKCLYKGVILFDYYIRKRKVLNTFSVINQ